MRRAVVYLILLLPLAARADEPAYRLTDAVKLRLEAAIQRGPDPAGFRVAFERAAARDPAAIAKLLKALSHPEPEVVSNASRILGWLKVSEAFDRMAALARDSKNPQIRQGAVIGLAALDDPRAVDVLLGALDDHASDVSFIAAGSLGKYKDPRVAKALLDHLNHLPPTDVLMRAAAIDSLGKLDDPVAVIAVENEIRNSPNPGMRHESAEMLVKAGRKSRVAEDYLAVEKTRSALAQIARALVGLSVQDKTSLKPGATLEALGALAGAPLPPADGWGRPWNVELGKGELRIASAGADAAVGTPDDLSVVVTLPPKR